VKAEEVSKRLAEEFGVVTLPSVFFSEETRGRNDVHVGARAAVDWAFSEQAGEVKGDERWIRFSGPLLISLLYSSVKSLLLGRCKQ
jgi:hypothetical protein